MHRISKNKNGEILRNRHIYRLFSIYQRWFSLKCICRAVQWFLIALRRISGTFDQFQIFPHNSHFHMDRFYVDCIGLCARELRSMQLGILWSVLIQSHSLSLSVSLSHLSISISETSLSPNAVLLCEFDAWVTLAEFHPRTHAHFI